MRLYYAKCISLSQSRKRDDNEPREHSFTETRDDVKAAQAEADTERYVTMRYD